MTDIEHTGPWTLFVCPTSGDPYTCNCGDGDFDVDCQEVEVEVAPLAALAGAVDERDALERKVRVLSWLYQDAIGHLPSSGDYRRGLEALGLAGGQ